jgi:hypothetical protein
MALGHVQECKPEKPLAREGEKGLTESHSSSLVREQESFGYDIDYGRAIHVNGGQVRSSLAWAWLRCK